jgi:hypothetical protein
MGPYLYVTPPSPLTYFHQDGHGTVDSGHYCMSGYNEVIMMRRLTERHKQHALWLLTGKADSPEFFDGLYGLPHAELPHADSLVCCLIWKNSKAFPVLTFVHL